MIEEIWLLSSCVKRIHPSDGVARVCRDVALHAVLKYLMVVEAHVEARHQADVANAGQELGNMFCTFL